MPATYGNGLSLLAHDHYHAPRWPDPAYPQQFHLDVGVPDLEVAERQVRAGGGKRVDDGSAFWRTYTDPAGHPFCLLPEKAT